MAMKTMIPIREMAERAVKASRVLATAPTDLKNRALRESADQFVRQSKLILAANADDVDAAKKGGQASALIDRLTLTPSRIEAMATGLRTVADLPDPVGEIAEEWRRPNGLIVRKVRIPLGVIGMIYESRPNVTADAAALCLKSGNAVILRGGREALRSNEIIAAVLQRACISAGIPMNAIQLISDPDYSILDEMLKLDGLVDLIIPRGGEALIERVSEKSRIPVLKHAKGVCHVYVDREADLTKASEIAFNAKVQRPGVCNAMETLLVHQNIAKQFLPQIISKYQRAGVVVKGCDLTQKIVSGIETASEEDWSTEYLDLIVSIRVVPDTDQAIEHIELYGSKHTEAIVTENTKTANEFVRRVLSSAVLVNASTRFNDGAELGLGAEIGISTTKLHAFGPMGLRELTTTKFVIWGDGQIRV